MDNFKIRIFDDLSGEIVPLDKRPSDMKTYILSIDDKQKSILLTKVNWLRKTVASAEKAIKDYIKSVATDFDDDGVAMWQEFKLKKVITYRFDKSKLESEGTQEEKDIYEKYKQLEEKYKSPSVSVRI